MIHEASFALLSKFVQRNTPGRSTPHLVICGDRISIPHCAGAGISPWSDLVILKTFQSFKVAIQPWKSRGNILAPQKNDMGMKNSIPLRLFRTFFNRRERWGLSWRGWVMLALSVSLAGWVLIRNAHSYLATTHREQSKILVVEGWVHDFGIEAAVQEFKTRQYERVFTTGGPLEGAGSCKLDL